MKNERMMHLTGTRYLKKALATILLDSIDADGYEGVVVDTDKEKVAFLYDCFSKEYYHEYNVNYYKGNVQRIWSEYLRGLPSCVSFPFENYKRLELAKECGIEFRTETEEDNFLERYWSMLAMVILELGRKYEITPVIGGK